MVQAKTVFDALKQSDATAAKKAQEQAGFSIFHPSTWGGETVAPPAQRQQPAASAVPAGVGGYIPGRRYSGKTYKGGDPNDPDNWQ
jgi:hypothetical protein